MDPTKCAACGLVLGARTTHEVQIGAQRVYLCGSCASNRERAALHVLRRARRAQRSVDQLLDLSEQLESGDKPQ